MPARSGGDGGDGGDSGDAADGGYGGMIDPLDNGRFARDLAREAAAVRDLRVYDLHGASGVPSQEEITTLEAGDLTNAYEELTGSLPRSR